jgi:transposase
MRWVGLDVHARETCAAVFDQASGEVAAARIAGRSSEVVAWLQTLEGPWRAVYEAGPTGYVLARRARRAGLEVDLCAPGSIPRRPTDRIKTDPRDALRLARLLAAGELVLVRVPELAEEQLRDLVRAREDLRVDLMRARHRLSKFLLRREVVFPGPGGAWTRRHRDWLVGLRFDDPASEIAFADMFQAIDSLLARRERLEGSLAELVPCSPWAAQVGRLRCLRGIDTLSAVGLCAEIGDFGRFAHPRFLSGYLGLVPAEDSSGERRRLGSITKAGSRHARRLPGPGRGRRGLGRPAAPAWALAAPGGRARQALHAHRRGGGPRTQHLLLGARPHGLSGPTTPGCRGGAGPRPSRTSGPRSAYGQPPRGGGARS